MPISAQAGQMRKTIVIEQRTSNPDGAGEPSFVWSLLMSRRAAIIRNPGEEKLVGQGRQARVPTTFVTRFPRVLKVLPQMRLRCDGVLFEILSAIDPDGMKAELQLTCVELTNEPTT